MEPDELKRQVLGTLSTPKGAIKLAGALSYNVRKIVAEQGVRKDSVVFAVTPGDAYIPKDTTKPMLIMDKVERILPLPIESDKACIDSVEIVYEVSLNMINPDDDLIQNLPTLLANGIISQEQLKYDQLLQEAQKQWNTTDCEGVIAVLRDIEVIAGEELTSGHTVTFTVYELVGFGIQPKTAAVVTPTT